MPLLTATKKYADIPVPALIIFANPHGLGTWMNDNTDPAVQRAAESYSSELTSLTTRQEKAVEQGVPKAHVITIPGASHHVFLSNGADVIRQMRNFLNKLN